MSTTFTKSTLRHRTRLACGIIPLLNLLQSRGVSPDKILSAVNIRKAELIDPAFTITFEQELDIVQQALLFLEEPSASLELARHYHLHNYSVLGLAIRACATLGDIFNLILRYPRLVWGICETKAEVQGLQISFYLHAGESREERFLLMRDMACIKTLFGEALGKELNLQEVHFSDKAPKDITPYQKFFNCPVLFEQKTSTLSFLLADLDLPVPSADALSLEFYEAQCARLSAQIDEPFRYTYLVRDYLLQLSPMPSLEVLADKLVIEPRTLQRLLKKEDKTFSQILKEVRYQRAKDRLLYASMTAELIADELGFNDAVAFSHAFKEWSGLAPRAWLQQQTSNNEK